MSLDALPYLSYAGLSRSSLFGAYLESALHNTSRQLTCGCRDKRVYDTIRPDVHPVSCLQTGETKYSWRVPDATFGLATFRPGDYQTAVASYALDAERLRALTLHRDCGLIADPRWGDANLVFPFAVYEAKGWTGDPGDARRQACAAASVYLDMLDALARQPGKPGKVGTSAYQSTESRNSQVFAITSFGAHWHIMVGYRRPRLAREHRQRLGMSDTVYVSTLPSLPVATAFVELNAYLTRPSSSSRGYGAAASPPSRQRGSCSASLTRSTNGA